MVPFESGLRDIDGRMLYDAHLYVADLLGLLEAMLHDLRLVGVDHWLCARSCHEDVAIELALNGLRCGPDVSSSGAGLSSILARAFTSS